METQCQLSPEADFYSWPRTGEVGGRLATHLLHWAQVGRSWIQGGRIEGGTYTNKGKHMHGFSGNGGFLGIWAPPVFAAFMVLSGHPHDNCQLSRDSCVTQHAVGTITESACLEVTWQLSWLQLVLPPPPEEALLASKHPVLRDKQDRAG